MNTIINIYKPVGVSSNGALYQVKKIIGEKKIGHLGTLDPLAEGVLPIFLGKMTKLISFCNQEDKSYRVTMKLGASSTTLDAEGELTPVPIPETCDEKAIEEAVFSFLGEIEQVPPMYSALKHKGKPLYDYARKGVDIERKARKITIHSIIDLAIELPYVTFEVACSKGTYIRTLADDIGKKLGTAAYLTKLVRTRCGDFFAEGNSFTLDQVRKMVESNRFEFSVSPLDIFPEFHQARVDADQIKSIGHGMSVELSFDAVSISKDHTDSAQTLVSDQNGQVVAIGTLDLIDTSKFIFNPSKVLI